MLTEEIRLALENVVHLLKQFGERMAELMRSITESVLRTAADLVTMFGTAARTHVAERYPLLSQLGTGLLL